MSRSAAPFKNTLRFNCPTKPASPHKNMRRPSKAEAEAKYTEAWREFVRGKYGTEPIVTYFESPVTVDNVAKQVFTDQ